MRFFQHSQRAFTGLARKIDTMTRATCVGLALSALVSGCGGGGQGESTANAGSYLAVTGTKQVVGNPIVTICLDSVDSNSINAQTAKGQDIAAVLARFYFITGNYKITSSNFEGCSALPGAVIVSVDYYNGTILPWDIANPATGPNNTNSTVPSSFVPNTSTAYRIWTNNVNSTGIRDFGGNVFGSRASDGQIFHWPGGGIENMLNGLKTVGADLFSSSGKIGYVGEADAVGGGKLAALYCTSGAGMSISVTSSGWVHSCQPNSGSGGSPSPGGTTTPYGAISFGETSSGIFFGISVNNSDQSTANTGANNQCRSESGGTAVCGVVLNIVGAGRCGAVAIGTNGGWGASEAADLASAQSSALSACRTKTQNCTVRLYGCNGS
jgi:Domain of unknown function (DUF4189)